MHKFALTLALLGSVAFAQTAPEQPLPVQPAAAQTATAPTDKPAPDAVVARVGNQTFTLAEFDKAFRVAVARIANAQGMPVSDELLQEFADSRADYLKQFARDAALYQLARVTQKPDAAAVDAQIAQARSDFETDADFNDALEGTGFSSVEDFRATLEREAVVGPYMQGLQKRFNFGNAVVSSFYNLNKANFVRDAEACVRHILVPTEAEAKAIVTDLSTGQDFATIAKAKSKDPGSAAEGGDLGCIAPGDTVEAFDKASFTGPLNQPQVVQTEFGWHVLTVSRRSEAGTIPFAEAAPLIREQLAREAAQKYLDAQLTRIKTETFPTLVQPAGAQPAQPQTP